MLAAAVIAAASIGGIPQSDFRYERQLPSRVADGNTAFEPDRAMLAHSRPGFSDLRIIDSGGSIVSWRMAPERAVSTGREVAVLNRGRQQDGTAVALLDVGLPRQMYERVTLRLAGGNFVGRVTAFGADRREGPFTQLSTTTVYDVDGATSARSTTIVLPATDSRYLQLRGEGVAPITGATIQGGEERPKLVARAHTIPAGIRTRGRETVATLDLGARGTPITRIEVGADSPARYDRPISVEGSNDRLNFVPLTSGRITRAPGTLSPTVSVDSEYRYLRLRIANGDDPRLGDVATATFGPSRAIIVERGAKPPLTAYYGASIPAPDYEFARLPVAAPGQILAPVVMPPEHANVSYRAPQLTQSYGDRNRWIVQVGIGLAALAVALVGVVAMRRQSA